LRSLIRFALFRFVVLRLLRFHALLLFTVPSFVGYVGGARFRCSVVVRSLFPFRCLGMVRCSFLVTFVVVDYGAFVVAFCVYRLTFSFDSIALFAFPFRVCCRCWAILLRVVLLLRLPFTLLCVVYLFVRYVVVAVLFVCVVPLLFVRCVCCSYVVHFVRCCLVAVVITFVAVQFVRCAFTFAFGLIILPLLSRLPFRCAAWVRFTVSRYVAFVWFVVTPPVDYALRC